VSINKVWSIQDNHTCGGQVDEPLVEDGSQERFKQSVVVPRKGLDGGGG